MAFRPTLTLTAALIAAPALGGGIPESAYDQLRWRLLGPFRAGWALCTAGVPGDPTTFYFGAATLEKGVASAKPEARTIAEQLASLETDLEASDALPTQPQLR